MTNRQFIPALVVFFCGALLSLGADTDTKPKFKLSRDEQTILDLTNEIREQEKLEPLEANAELCEAARAHSANMAKKGRMEHVLDGKTPADRIAATGYRSGWAGENIAMGERLGPRGAFKLWMNSPPHKENILKDRYREIGIGIARNAYGEVYFTQVFASPRSR